VSATSCGAHVPVARRRWRGPAVADDIDIRDGGVVAVDTQSLRNAAGMCTGLSASVHDVADALGAAARRLAELGLAGGIAVSSLAHDVALAASLAAMRADDLDDIAHDLHAAADAYEVIELRARAAMADSPPRAEAARAALAAFLAQHLEAASRADAAARARDLSVGAELTDLDNSGVHLAVALGWLISPLVGVTLAGVARTLPPASQGAQALIRALGTGVIPAGSHLDGEAPAVRLRETSMRAAVAPPDDLAEALGRIPQGGARVRIETYSMPDGTERYAIYLAGTRDFSHMSGGTDPWDMQSNLRLYFGHDAAAYEAVRAAMRDAGVPSGAQVYLFGHSQGGLIADWLAVQGGYDVPMLVTAGSPTEAEVGDATLSIQLRHTDDVVQSLTAGGSDARVGGEGSMIVERAGEPGMDLDDVTDAAHHLTAYIATAKMVDASTDPRTARMRAQLVELRGATSVEAAEYDATRVVPAKPAPKPEPAPRPAPRPLPTPASGGGGA